jgi:hypothetical protein
MTRVAKLVPSSPYGSGSSVRQVVLEELAVPLVFVRTTRAVPSGTVLADEVLEVDATLVVRYPRGQRPETVNATYQGGLLAEIPTGSVRAGQVAVVEIPDELEPEETEEATIDRDDAGNIKRTVRRRYPRVHRVARSRR